MEEGLPYRSDTPAVQISQTKYRIVTTLQRHIADDYYYGTSPSRGECVVTSSSLSVVMRMKLTNLEQLLNILCVMTQSSGVPAYRSKCENVANSSLKGSRVARDFNLYFGSTVSGLSISDTPYYSSRITYPYSLTCLVPDLGLS